jgi:hypothetical protein
MNTGFHDRELQWCEQSLMASHYFSCEQCMKTVSHWKQTSGYNIPGAILSLKNSWKKSNRVVPPNDHVQTTMSKRPCPSECHWNKPNPLVITNDHGHNPHAWGCFFQFAHVSFLPGSSMDNRYLIEWKTSCYGWMTKNRTLHENLKISRLWWTFAINLKKRRIFDTFCQKLATMGSDDKSKKLFELNVKICQYTKKLIVWI